MIQLQKPPYVYMNGRITAWDDAKIHVSSEALIRGISVFEGIKGYWRRDNSAFSLLALQEHFERLQRSARLQHLPFEMDYARFSEACRGLARLLVVPEKDMWLRATLVSVEGQWGEGTVSDLVITAYHQEQRRPDPIDAGISTWQRPADTAYPARIKSAANYQVGRLARIEGRRQGFTDMILLNQWGRVAEATGACVLISRHGRIATPPPYEGCLESITVDIVEAICAELAIAFERRPVDRSELAVADAACLAGTLMELGRIRHLESRLMPGSDPLFDQVSAAFWRSVRGDTELYAAPLTEI